MANITFSGGSEAGGGFSGGLWGVAFIFTLLSDITTTMSGNASQVTFTNAFTFGGPTTLVANGTFSNYNATGPQSGTVTSFTYTTYFTAGVPVTMTVTGISISVANLNTWTINDNVAALEAALFGAADTITGTAYADSFNGYGGNDTIDMGGGNDNCGGGSGDDIINGGDGNDYLSGQDGADILEGGDGADILFGDVGNDLVRGDAGNDTINYAIGDGADAMDGGADSDTINFSGNANENSLSVAYDGLNLTGAFGGLITNVETIHANMGGGTDWLIYASSADLIVNLTTQSGSGFNTLIGVENLIGGSGGDTFTGDGAANRLDGGIGNDSLTGDDGVNKLNGGDGADTITGGLGDDLLNGGAGADRFVYAAGAGVDTISGFDATGGQDLIDLTALGVTSGDFGARVTITDLGDDTLVSIDGAITITLLGVNGDGANAITDADFLLGP